MKTLFLAGAVAALAAANPAGAVLVDSIRITSATGSYLQVAELQAFAGATNAALAANGGVATSFSSQFGFTGPDKANDGLTDGQPYGDGVYLSQGTSGSEFLLVTLAHAYDLTSLTIFGREDCCEGRDVFHYQLSNGGVAGLSGTIDASGHGAANSGTATFAAAVPEPAAWSLMVAGFGAVGFAVRRRGTAAGRTVAA